MPNICAFTSQTANCDHPSHPTNGYITLFISKLEGTKLTVACWTADHSGCNKVNVTAVCNKQGHWEPSIDNICGEPTGNNISL